MSVPMDELTRILWLNRKVKAPVEIVVMDIKPPHNCTICEQFNPAFNPQFGTRWLHRSEVTCGSNGEPWKVWKVSTKCGECGSPSNWLIDPDQPANAFKPDEKEYAFDFPFDNATEPTLDPNDFLTNSKEAIDWAKPLSVGQPKDADIPFDDFPRLYGESDYDAYVRWLKHCANKRKDIQNTDDNDAS